MRLAGPAAEGPAYATKPVRDCSSVPHPLPLHSGRTPAGPALAREQTVEIQEQPKPASESLTEMTEIVLPSDGNALGTAFGGKVMQWIDVCAAISAMRHCRKVVVTASMDELHFHAPIKVGEVVHLTARVNAAFKRSLELGVEVYSEQPVTGVRRHTCSALLTFAALDAEGNPTTVPPLLIETEADRLTQAAAASRREQRLANRRRTAPED